ncbi:virulence protein RhuM/Fic/DOC family protein [Aliamphritea spongicola]|uniref:virulence protein RhuM/Fic/DOC family protein n=1 Tax=Aliamphritea spongicola TaxID=707589 RepID=UPI001FAF33FD|nr:virulence protein RhuM/Fic/DOC family protein [Aliamphritea spongicola]
MAELFGTRRPAITKHLNNIYTSAELREDSTCSILEHMGTNKRIYSTKHYNLDAVISVGYRVNSSRATQFRIWANRILKQHLIQGFSINEQRLREQGHEFKQTIDLLNRTLRNQQLIDPAGADVLSVISNYVRSWSLILGYDEATLGEIRHTQQQKQMRQLSHRETESAIETLKQELISKGEATQLFALQRNNGLWSAINTIEQGFAEELFYPNIASRAANLLYLIIKNHPFTDGNKRTGAFMFIWYLNINKHLLAKPTELMINDNTLVALTLMIAESAPAQKELMIRLTEHFIELSDQPTLTHFSSD